jgi:pimeloyl-ACP methyl ester carboxylesterase
MPKIAVNKDVEIYYETMGEGIPLILVMGISTQFVHWPEGFCQQLVDRGFQVIRFDNRDVGFSTKLNQYGRPNPRTLLFRGLMGLSVKAPYNLSDMGNDVIGLMDALELKSAHIAGVSMGGMISQTVALEHSHRIRSLTSIMSTTGDRYIGKLKAIRAILTPPGKTKDEHIERGVGVFRVLAGDKLPFDEAAIRDLIARAYDRDSENKGFTRQFAAIVASGSRRKALKELKVPALVIHGAQDPLIPVKAGIATAKAIPGSKLHIIEKMAHSMPSAIWSELTQLIQDHAQQYEKRSERLPSI